jgi:glycosyltransferase involved in cell wall biosynthesis
MARMAYKPLVSIVIPVFNGANYLSESISSALSQIYKNIEVLVINDGSKDFGATKRIAEKYGDQIRYYEKENGGVASALNLGIQLMRGEWFSWLSHDDLYHSAKIAKQVEYINNILDSNPKVRLRRTLIYCNMDLINDKGRRLIAPPLDLVNGLSNEELIITNIKKNQFGGCTFLLPKSCFDEVGTFNTNLRTVCDVELWYRFLFAGYEFHYIPEVLVSNRMHPEQVTYTMEREHQRESYAFHEWVIDKIYQNEKYRRAELFRKLGKYMDRKNIPAADKAYQIAQGLSGESLFSKAEISLSRLRSRLYFHAKNLLKKAYIYLFIKR